MFVFNFFMFSIFQFKCQIKNASLKIRSNSKLLVPLHSRWIKELGSLWPATVLEQWNIFGEPYCTFWTLLELILRFEPYLNLLNVSNLLEPYCIFLTLLKLYLYIFYPYWNLIEHFIWYWFVFIHNYNCWPYVQNLWENYTI